MRTSPVLTLYALTIIFSNSFLHAKTVHVLDLNTYLDQVRSQNDEWKGSNLAAQGAMLRSEEGELLLSPSIFGEGSYTRNERETFTPSFQGRRTDTQLFSLGIGQQTTFGLNAKAGYVWGSTHIFGTDSNFVQTPSYWEGSPYIEMTQSLWRNFLGSEVKANQVLIHSQAMAIHYRELFKNKELLSDAEYTYWRLSLARENLMIQQDSIERSEKLRKWSEKQLNNNLVDKGEYFQTIASFESRRFEFQSAQHEEAQSARAFNTYRKIEKENVDETLENISELQIDKLTLPQKMPYREDVLETQELENAARAASIVGREKNRPRLELFGNMTLFGREERFESAYDESLTDKHPVYTVGIRLNAAIDFDNVSNVKQGYSYETTAADLRFRGKYFNQEQRWKDLNLRFKEAKIRWKTALAAEKAQKQKVDHERTKHTRGRTTVYQVLQFEQDYANTQLMRINSQVQVIDLFTELKTFGAKS